MTPRQFIAFFLMVLVVSAIAGAAFGQTPTPKLAECPTLVSSDKTIVVTKQASSTDQCPTPGAKVTRVEDTYLGLVCLSTDDKMSCSAFEPTDYTPDPELSFCISTPSLTHSGEIQTSVWTVKGPCTPNPLSLIPHRVVRIGLMGGTVCLEPGKACASLKTLLPVGQQRLVQMGVGGAFQKLLEGVIGKPGEQRG